MKAPLASVPALPAAFGIVAGIIIFGFKAWLVVMALCIATFAALYATKRHYASFFFLWTCIGIALALAFKPNEPPTYLLDENISFSGVVQSEKETVNGNLIAVNIDSAQQSPCRKFTAQVFTQEYIPDLQPGCRLSFIGKMTSFDSSQLIPYERDYGKTLRNEGITASCFAQQGSIICNNDNIGAFSHLITHTRHTIFNSIVNSPIDGQTAGFLVAAILGDRRFIDIDEMQAFRASGVAHIIALSGLHVGIIASLLAFVLIPLRLSRKGAAWRNILIILFVWFYSYVVGLAPSVVRASTMISVMLIASLLQRSSNMANSLCLAIVITLAFNPYSLFSVGFQLSFAAVASILLFSEFIPKSLYKHKIWLLVVNTLVTPVAAMIGTGLISVFYFSSFPMLFLLSNVIAGLLFPWILGGGIVLALMQWMGVSFTLLGTAVDFLYNLLNAATLRISAIGIANVSGITFSPWALIPYALTIFFVLIAVVKHKHGVLPRASYRIIGALGASSFAIFLIITIFTREHIPQSEIHIPTGKTDCMILRAGKQAYIKQLSSKVETNYILDNFNTRFSGFLRHRQCLDSFALLPEDIDQSGLFVKDNWIVCANTAIALIGDEPLLRHSAKAHYAIVSNDYKGTAADIVASVRPDTILFLPTVHFKKKQKLIDECADSIPHRVLTGKFSIIQQ